MQPPDRVKKQIDLVNQSYKLRQFAQAKVIAEGLLSQSIDQLTTSNQEYLFSVLGEIYYYEKAYKKALPCFQQAIQLSPKVANHYANAAVILQALGNPNQALLNFQMACQLDPKNPGYFSNLGAFYQKFGELEKAIKAFQKAIELDPKHAMAYANLAYVNYQFGLIGEGLANAKKALSLESNNPVALMNLGLLQVNQGNIHKGIASFDRVIELNANEEMAFSNKVYASTYSDEISDQALFKLHQSWGNHWESRIKPYETDLNDKKWQKRLKIGYLGSDFRSHPVAYALIAFLPFYDKEKLEITCYANLVKPDQMTNDIKQCVDHFYSVAGLSDADLAQKIYDDQIDILIDLNGHTAKSRLLVCAYKPAPIQCCHIGYPMTTGLSRIDYLIADKQVCPEKYQHLYTEKIAYLPDCVFSFRPHPFSPDVSNLPMLKNGYITFGCFNNLPKLTPTVIKLWSEILINIPTATLILKSRPFNDVSTRQRYLSLFQNQGIEADRITFRGPSSHPEMLAELADIDVALDPFPFAGGTTTAEMLWQGIPVITLKGSRFSQNMGVTYLHNLGLDDWITTDKAAYIDKAIECANHPGELSMLRSKLRNTMQQSIICDGKRFAKQLEELYQRLWYNYL